MRQPGGRCDAFSGHCELGLRRNAVRSRPGALGRICEFDRRDACRPQGGTPVRRAATASLTKSRLHFAHFATGSLGDAHPAPLPPAHPAPARPAWHFAQFATASLGGAPHPPRRERGGVLHILQRLLSVGKRDFAPLQLGRAHRIELLAELRALPGARRVILREDPLQQPRRRPPTRRPPRLRLALDDLELRLAKILPRPAQQDRQVRAVPLPPRQGRRMQTRPRRRPAIRGARLADDRAEQRDHPLIQGARPPHARRPFRRAGGGCEWGQRRGGRSGGRW